MLSWLFQTLVAAAAGGAISLLCFVFLLPTKIGEKAIGLWFDKNLEGFKSEQNEKLARLQGQINHVTDRGRLSNEREYAATAKAWERYVNARLTTLRVAYGFVEYPDLDSLREDDLDDFLKSTKLSSQEVNQIKNASDKKLQYSRTVQIRDINEASKALNAARDTIMKQSVFIQKDLYDLFETNLARLNAAWAEERVSIGMKNSMLYEAKHALILNDASWIGELRSKVRDQLLRAATDRPA